MTVATIAPTLDDARTALRQHFGFQAFRPGQERAVECVLSGRDTMVILPTGGGKSVCYQVPALVLPRLTVVISPLISLMKDQVDALTARGLPATFVNSTLSAGETANRLARVQRGEVKLLYVAPERFDQGTLAERLREVGVSLLAIDEAHCVSGWGHDFRPAYLRIAAVREKLGWPSTVALTATATPEVRRDIARQLRLEDPETIITGFDRTNLTYHVVRTRTESDKDEALARVLREYEGQAIVYASTRKAVERIARVLEQARIPAVAYHAGLDDAHRHEVQDDFMAERARAIVATNAFGMGIDKPNVRLVVHHAMPGTLEAYYQEAGRAGRDGLAAHCVLLHAFPDRFTHEFFIRGSYPERKTVEQVYESLRRAADSTGRVDVTPESIATRLPGKISSREVESALRVLTLAGAYRVTQEGGWRADVRLLATPERIKRELSGPDDAMALDFLRSMWRLFGDAVYDGASVDLDGLPPGFGGGVGAMDLLESLAERQFVDWSRASSGAFLAAPRKALGAFPIDWATIDRRRAADFAKLEAMQGYAYISGCRRAYVLRYFGDPAATARCEGCDNCLGTHTEAAPAREPALGAAKARKRAAGAARAAVAEELPTLTPADERVLATLRALRARLAKEAQVPSYVVFADRTLMELAVRRPRSLGAFAEVRGVGPAKLDKYGDAFLAAIREAIDPEAA